MLRLSNYNHVIKGQPEEKAIAALLAARYRHFRGNDIWRRLRRRKVFFSPFVAKSLIG
jgi:hypothetical protein